MGLRATNIMTLHYDEGFAATLRQAKLIAFDVDGTLTDSIEQIILCFERTFAYANLPVPSPQAIKGTIGMSLALGIQSLLPDPSDEKLAAQVTQLYRDTFSVSKDINVTKLFAGTKEMLETLYNKGYILAIASGKSKIGVDRFLDDVPEIKPYFSIVCTGDSCKSKPHPDMIEIISAKSGVSVDKIIGVGDALLDIQMFRNARCHELGVLTGVCDFYDLEDLNCEFILPKAVDIINYL